MWSHICAALPSEQLSAVESVDLKLPTSLDDLAKRAKRPKKPKEPGKKTSPKRLSKAMEHLIGLSGEIHAFRMLQIRYGGSVVSPASWISSYSAVVGLNDLDSTDNDRGCDFVIVMADRTYCIEVKSSEGDQETFTLGSSEIRLAMGLAKKSKKRRKETFLVLRVLNALEATPTFQLLPNPYDPKYQSLYVIEEADARVRYQT